MDVSLYNDRVTTALLIVVSVRLELVIASDIYVVQWSDDDELLVDLDILQ